MTPAEKVAAAKPPRKAGAWRKRPWACKIREARHKKLRLSIRDVAQGVGMSIAGMWELEHGTDPQLTTARKIADFFGMTIEELWPERV